MLKMQRLRMLRLRRKRSMQKCGDFGQPSWATSGNLSKYLQFAREDIIRYRLCKRGYQGRRGTFRSSTPTLNIDLSKMIQNSVEDLFRWAKIEYEANYKMFGEPPFVDGSFAHQSMFIETAVETLIRAATGEEIKGLTRRRRSTRGRKRPKRPRRPRSSRGSRSSSSRVPASTFELPTTFQPSSSNLPSTFLPSSSHLPNTFLPSSETAKCPSPMPADSPQNEIYSHTIKNIVPHLLKQHAHTGACLTNITVDMATMLNILLPKLFHWTQLAVTAPTGDWGKSLAARGETQCTGSCWAALSTNLVSAVDAIIMAVEGAQVKPVKAVGKRQVRAEFVLCNFTVYGHHKISSLLHKANFLCAFILFSYS